ncbi:MAG: hypothetical protein DVS81_01685 [Candidatus Accumulibacter meliphilus]|uniref:Uncharacterized protein n=1 Tax=Candidatus Accumulibacter meliphilus TaxID=2211374 RepID=A0A369XYR0_9PROT|nr:MAG: hypothetical protein DVS81_01685 [Candidatus Accumulibacter meliphilus]
MELNTEIVRVFPYDMIILASIKVDILEVIFSYTPVDGNSQPDCVTGLEVNPRTLKRNVGDDEVRALYFSHDLHVDAI